MRLAALLIASAGAAPNNGVGRTRWRPAPVGAASTSWGRITAAAPCGAVVAARNALATASGALPGSLISPANFVTVFIVAAAFIDLGVRLSPSARPTAPHRDTTRP